ncbi:MAG: sensor histidine kinase [Bacillota bacterium]
MLYALFINHMSEIYFVYGLSFFVMSIAITLQSRRGSTFTMAGSLPLLALFAFLHGLSEWAYFYIPYKAPFLSPEWVYRLRVVEVNLIGISFALLLFFGIRLLGDVVKKRWFRCVFCAAASLALLWFGYFVVYRLVLIREDAGHWLALSDIFSRYFFGLPGGLFSAFAVYRQKDQVRAFGGPAIQLSLTLLALSFLGYAIFSGLIVPPASFFPASFFNTTNIFRWTMIPTALFRTFFSLCITVSMLKVLELFQIEKTAFINKVVSENAVLLERERIKRDLHDGIIQSLYALGLQLKEGEYLLEEKNIDEARAKMAASIEKVDGIIRDLREYILDLKRAELARLGLDEILGNLAGLCERFKLQVSIDNRVREHICLMADMKMHLYHILQELVTNVIKHADAKRINVTLLPRGKSIVVTVEDDGRGFSPEILRQRQKAGEKIGLFSVEERIRSMGGCFKIDSMPGEGATIVFEIPL